MKAKEHSTIGFIVGGIGGGIYAISTLPEKNPPLEKILYLISCILVGGGIGYLASCLPDILEPAMNPHHRKIFHSILMLLLSAGVTIESKNPVLKTAAAGYASHLFLDATTPMGLPIV